MLRSDRNAPLPDGRELVQKHWYGNEPRPKRRSLSTGLTRFALCLLVVVGGAAIASHLGGIAHARHAGSLME